MIRPVLPGAAHARSLAVLAAEAFGGAHWSAGELLAHAATPGGVLLADSECEKALCLLRVAADEAEILDIGVVPAARRQGLGRALLEAALAHAARQGAARAFLEVAEDNASARALYASAGFARVGRRPRYYRRPDGARCDALILARDLGEGG